jgi:hypothetical protein
MDDSGIIDRVPLETMPPTQWARIPIIMGLVSHHAFYKYEWPVYHGGHAEEQRRRQSIGIEDT